MNLITQIPLLNSIRFVKKDLVVPDGYHTKHFDDYLFRDQIKDWQEDALYNQKIEQAQRVCILVHTQHVDDLLSYPPTLVLVDEEGFPVAGVDMGTYFRGIQNIPGNVASDGTLLDSSLWSFKFDQMSIPDGIYYLILTNNGDGAHSESYKSEPLQIQQTHAETMLIAYAPDPDDPKDLVMTGFSVTPQFSMRIEGMYYRYQPVSDFITSIDENFNSQNLKAGSWDTFTLHIGDEIGLPDYMVQKMASILTCPYIKIDGKRFVYYNSNNNSTTGINTEIAWTIIRPDDTYPLVAAETKIARLDNTDAFTFNTNKIKLFDIPGTYPFAFPSLFYLINHDLSVILYDTPRIIEDSAGLDAYVTYLNGAFALNNDLSGTVVREATSVTYQLGDGEDWVEYVIPTSTDFITVPINTSAANLTWSFNFKYGNYVVDWGDNIITWNSSYSSSSIVAAAHKYVNAGNYNARLFTNNNSSYLEFTKPATGTTPDITDMPTGSLSSSLTDFRFNNYDLSAHASINASFLTALHATLQSITITGCKIKAFVPPLMQLAYPQKWNALTYVYLTGNSLPASEIDALFTNFFGVVYAAGGLFYTKTQVPTAPPTAASNSARTFISSVMGWSIVTD